MIRVSDAFLDQGSATLAYLDDEVVLLNLIADWEFHTIEQLVLKHTNWVRIANGSLEQSLGVLCRVWSNNFQARNRAIPR